MLMNFYLKCTAVCGQTSASPSILCSDSSILPPRSSERTPLRRWRWRRFPVRENRKAARWERNGQCFILFLFYLFYKGLCFICVNVLFEVKHFELHSSSSQFLWSPWNHFNSRPNILLAQFKERRSSLVQPVARSQTQQLQFGTVRKTGSAAARSNNVQRNLVESLQKFQEIQKVSGRILGKSV